MNNIQSDFKAKARTAGNPIYAGRINKPGIYTPNGSTAPMDVNNIRADRAAGAGRAGVSNPIRLGPGEIMPETAGRGYQPDFTVKTGVPGGNNLTAPGHYDGDPLYRQASDRQSLKELSEYKAEQARKSFGGRVKSAWSGATNPEAWKAGGRTFATGAKAARGGALALGGAALGVLPEAAMMEFGEDHARSKFYDDPSVSGFAKARQAVRDTSQMAWPAAGAVIGGTAGSAAGPLGTIGVGAVGMGAGHYVNGRLQAGFDKVDELTGGTGQSPLEDFKARAQQSRNARLAEADARGGFEMFGADDPRAKGLVDLKHGGINPEAKVAPTAMPQRIDPMRVPDGPMRQAIADGQVQDRNLQWKNTGIKESSGPAIEASTFGSAGNPNPFERAATPAAELARQSSNFDKYEGALNSGLAERVKASSGGTSFGDETAQALFNAKQQLNGSGISVTKGANGTPEFSGNNVNGQGGKLYQAADGSITNDWSKTKNYAEAIQRNKDDQDRLTELTRGAALSGDREAVQRLTAGDGRLQAIAADAATERDLRQAVRGGSAKAAQVLATMEASRATSANQQADLGLRRAALVGAQEDRDLSRQLRQDSLNERVASNQLSREKDARDLAMKGVETLDKQLEQYATVDGKLDGNRLSRIRGLAANLQKSPGQTDDSYRKDVTTLISLAGKLDDGQGWFDKLTSQTGNGGTDLRSWGKNESWRGGMVTDQGDHFSARQWNALSDDEKRMAKLLGMKGGK